MAHQFDIGAQAARKSLIIPFGAQKSEPTATLSGPPLPSSTALPATLLEIAFVKGKRVARRREIESEHRFLSLSMFFFVLDPCR